VATYREWEDNEIPYGYLITFRTYGTWLHGDDRGSVDRENNKYGTPRLEQNKLRESYHRSLMKRPPVLLDAEMRMTVEMAIREVCEIKRWDLRAINIRTNHGHAVTSTPDRNHSKILNAFKAYSTRKMRERGCWTSEFSPWSDKGSQRVLWNAEALWHACDYVINGQGADLDNYDEWFRRQKPLRDDDGLPSL
jgi:REP element-mobilizing transposase RayT